MAVLHGHSCAQKPAGLPVISSRLNIWVDSWLRYKYKHHRVKIKTRATVVFVMITQGTVVRWLPTQPAAESLTVPDLLVLEATSALSLCSSVCSRLFSSIYRKHSRWVYVSHILILCLCVSHRHSCSTEEPSSLPRTAEESGASQGESLHALLVFLLVAIRQVQTLPVSQLEQTSQSTCCHSGKGQPAVVMRLC